MITEENSLNPVAIDRLDHHSNIMLTKPETAPIDSHVGFNTPLGANKRKARGKTPIVDDEVRRSSRFHKEVAPAHVQLNNEPIKKKGEAMKSISVTTVEDLKKLLSPKLLMKSWRKLKCSPSKSQLW